MRNYIRSDFACPCCGTKFEARQQNGASTIWIKPEPFPVTLVNTAVTKEASPKGDVRPKKVPKGVHEEEGSGAKNNVEANH